MHARAGLVATPELHIASQLNSESLLELADLTHPCGQTSAYERGHQRYKCHDHPWGHMPEVFRQLRATFSAHWAHRWSGQPLMDTLVVGVHRHMFSTWCPKDLPAPGCHVS